MVQTKYKDTLPWRKNVSDENYPYKVMVSEFMLQQTGVSTVIPYFENFINRWPTIQKDLASAREEDILLAWQGLGSIEEPEIFKKVQNKFVIDMTFKKFLSLLRNCKVCLG